MKKYTQPTAKVVELSVKEPLSLTSKKNERTFGFGSTNKSVTVDTYLSTGLSALQLKIKG